MNKNSWNADDYSQKAAFVSNLAFSPDFINGSPKFKIDNILYF